MGKHVPKIALPMAKDNRTAGQCSVTAFLAQDIFGGKVYGIPLKDGKFHCFNVIGNSVFDLICAQFKNQLLNYADGIEQDRNIHFLKKEKYERYQLLKEKLKMSGNQ